MADELVELLKEAKEEAMKVSGGDVFEAEWMAAYLDVHGVTIPVLCKDCKHWDEIKHGYGWCCLDEDYHKYAKEEEFCSFGERRTDV